MPAAACPRRSISTSPVRARSATRSAPPVGHRVGRVQEQVQEELLEPLRVAEHAAAPARSCAPPRCRGAASFSPTNASVSSSSASSATGTRAAVRGRAMLSSALDDLRDARDLLLDRLRAASARLRRRWQLRLEHLGVALDHAHRRADLVGEAGDEGGDRGELLRGRARSRASGAARRPGSRARARAGGSARRAPRFR